MSRCFDCLAEFPADADRFAVLKQTRELPDDVDPAEAKDLQWALCDPVFVCGDCAGWYGDHAMPVTADEAAA